LYKNFRLGPAAALHFFLATAICPRGQGGKNEKDIVSGNN